MEKPTPQMIDYRDAVLSFALPGGAVVRAAPVAFNGIGFANGKYVISLLCVPHEAGGAAPEEVFYRDAAVPFDHEPSEELELPPP